MAQKTQDQLDKEQAARRENLAKAIASMGETEHAEVEMSKLDIKPEAIEHKAAKFNPKHQRLLTQAAKRRISYLQKSKKRKRKRRAKVV